MSFCLLFLLRREGFGVNPKSSLYKAVIQSKICEVAFTTGKDSCFFKTGKQISVYDLLADEAQGKATFSKVEGYIEYNGEVQKIKDFRNLKKLLNDIEQQELYMKAMQAKLPKQNAIELEDITLLQWEEYDATRVEVKSFRHHYDIVDDCKFNVGNMCVGYPFELCGVMFNNSEAANIARRIAQVLS